jgi:hypothetical protein
MPASKPVTAESVDLARTTAPALQKATRLENLRFIPPPSPSRQLGWDQAVFTAAAALNETWALPETRCHSAGAGVEEELAAFLCAFGALT